MEWMLYSLTTFTFLIGSTSQQNAQSAEVELTYMNNYPYGSMYQFQSRCSIPCEGSYRAGELEITIKFDKAVYNLYTFRHFETAQESPRRVWEIVNTNWMHANSRGLCEFDVQVDHTPGLPVPYGTCKLGWETPICGEITGKTTANYTCAEIRYDHLYLCYNSSISPQCCYTCEKFRMDLPGCEYGDRISGGCTTIADNNCYNENTNTTCCMTCHERRQIRQGMYNIPNCPFGDRTPSICNTVERRQCYNMEEQCCESCFWLADDAYPDCRFGDKRNCDTIVNSDCYNTTVANQCCEICHGLNDEEHPECPYGDKDPRCVSIERLDCYNTTIKDACCSTCREYENDDFQGCEFGDRESCDDVTQNNCSNSQFLRDFQCCEKCDYLYTYNCPEYDADFCSPNSVYRHDCYNRDTRQDCCNYCYGEFDGSMEEDNCEFGDKDGDCWYSIEPQDCYKRSIRRECCETCLDHYIEDMEDNCKYGDRTPDSCYQISGIDCYNNDTNRDCCEMCSYWEQPDSPNHCKYGDRSETCYSIAPYDCYNTTTEQQCCETCPSVDIRQNYSYGCRYGDKSDSCYREPYRNCYDASFRQECCRYCNDSANTAAPGCQYGDRSEQCTTIDSWDCYENASTCCSTCPYHVLHIVIDDCKYGDRQNCSGIQAPDCYDASVARQCCETCYYLREADTTDQCPFGDRASDCGSISQRECYTRQNDCCETCKNRKIDQYDIIEDCDYGDRASDCSGIYDWQCYNLYMERECCHTCFKRRHDTTITDCLYGDWTSSCSDARFHSSECYNNTRRASCCETCDELRTNDQNCEYGDKQVICQSILPSNIHLCYQLETGCCSTCLLYRDDRFPGCEYGDAMLDCRADMCHIYSSYDLRRCCSTCSNYTTTFTTRPSTTYSTTGTTSPTRSTTTDSTQTSDTDKQSGTTSRKTTVFTRSTQTSYKTVTSLSTSSTSLEPEPDKSGVDKFMDTIASIGPIVGGAVGGIVAIVIIILIACFIMRRRKTETPKRNVLPEHNSMMYSNNRARPQISQQSYPQRNPQQNRPQLKRQPTKEEVYDYIHPDDVKTVVSGPTYKPDLPERDLPDMGYMEPAKDGTNSHYTNPAFQNGSSDKLNNDYHTYHVLQKDNQDEGHNYAAM